MSNKRCPKCNRNSICKNGFQSGRQRYICKVCRYQFQNKKRSSALNKKIWHLYAHGKQTYSQIAEKYGRSIRWVQQVINDYRNSNDISIAPQKTPLIIDAVFWGRQWGLLVFRSPLMKRNLLWWEIEKELSSDYVSGINKLQSIGFEIAGITVDGKPGVIKKIEALHLPVQMCHFHQIQIVIRYTTRRPRLQVAKELKQLAQLLPDTDKYSFTIWLEEWHYKWQEFLNEKTLSEDGKHWRYTHERLRKAYCSLKRHLPYLFTYHYHPDLSNTTNSLDGTFAHIKDKVRVHRGLKRHRKLKLIDELLRGKKIL